MNEENKKLWKVTRILFYVTMGLWLLTIFFPIFVESLLFGLVWMGLGISTFVCSIIHLIKYKEKAFAITALVITSILNIMFFIGFIIGFTLEI